MFLLLGSLARAETKIVEATISDITERGFALTIGTEPLLAEDTGETHFWRSKSSVKRDAFKVGDRVFARIKTDIDPPQLREIADKGTWEWLDKIRTGAVQGTVDKVDDRYVTLKFPDGATFKFRATAKTQVTLKSNPSATLQDLQPGLTVWAKGRTLPTLDTWMVSVGDVPPEVKPSKSSKPKGKKAKVPVLPAVGKVTGTIVALVKPLKMIDALEGIRTLHFTYNEETRFYLDGKACRPEAMVRGMDFTCHYRRDKFGRLLATKVELFSRPRI